MNIKEIKNAYITVSKNEKEYCESGHYLTEVGFSERWDMVMTMHIGKIL